MNIGQKFAGKIPKPDRSIEEYLNMIRMNELSLYFRPTTEHEINKLITRLPNKQSSGYNDIDNVILKEIAPYITPVLTQIFNESLNTGTFPETFKITEVVPLHKGGKKNL